MWHRFGKARDARAGRKQAIGMYEAGGDGKASPDLGWPQYHADVALVGPRVPQVRKKPGFAF